METGVIIARFQTPYLHEGHMDLIQKVKEQHDKLIIILGVSPVKTSRKNPYDFYTRETMIKKEFNDVIVLPLSDHPSDEAWSQNLDNMLESAFPAEAFTLYGSRDSFIPYYHGKKPIVELPEHGDYSATELRKKYADKVSNSRDFRAGILYTLHNQYKKVYPTVDVAVFRNNKTEVLLGRKAISSNWRLVGGFSDPEDDSYEMAALREMREECGDLAVENLQYETSSKVDDWRYKNEADQIITLLFSCDYNEGDVIAQDDIKELQWFPLGELPKMKESNQLSPEHYMLFDFILNKYLTK
ncbi:NUDIX domain-containing protein [Marivirga sp. S37H4]|uniref:NUDIX domain-containing protein n=1 Tax=Marivirga aurantiaca TaxID=2802615 RepID=A0A934WZJ6_9BACT|nr:NUDIX domain-containing protein [Marivirga aurantiaca]MBK6265772.1 NUDIX domain-containing protein [Marivirga aurantiaca]